MDDTGLCTFVSKTSDPVSGGWWFYRYATPVLPDYPDSSGEILWNQRSLVYAYPAPGQTEVVPGAPIVLRFSHPLASPATAASLFTLRDLAAAQNVPFTLKVVDDGYGVVLQPNAALKPASRYQVIGETVALKDATTGETGTITLQATGQPAVIFRTRAALQGAATPQTLAGKDSFTVVHQQPNAGMFPLDSLSQAVPLMDFSSLRLQLSQPVDPRTANYGVTVRLEKAGELVAARLMVSGSRLTVDPVADLEPGASYTLRLTTGLRSLLGKALTPGAYAAYTFTPRDTGMAAGRSSRIKIDIPAGGVSMLTGAGINQVPVASPLLGQGAQARVGVGGHRAVHLFEQGHVVHGVAVERAVHIGPGELARGQPLLHARDLALAHGGHAVDLAGVPATGVTHQLHGQQLRHAQRLGDGGGHKLVGGGDDQHLVTRRLVLADEVECLRLDGRGDDLAHELLVRGRCGLGPAQTHGLGGKPHVVVHVERARLVVGVELVIAARELHRVVPADADGELAPLVVGVERQQRVVQVEKCQAKAASLHFNHSISCAA